MSILWWMNIHSSNQRINIRRSTLGFFCREQGNLRKRINFLFHNCCITILVINLNLMSILLWMNIHSSNQRINIRRSTLGFFCREKGNLRKWINIRRSLLSFLSGARKFQEADKFFSP